ncbi:nucleotidyltransferase family protein [Candidatus Dependentiae bacterium]|nr:nucleotidyltransferase family protein [Candidatus Dependentiae bacterium]
MLTIQDISDVLNKHQDTLREYNVIRLGLFGSYIRGEQKKDSDIDFLVEFDLTAFGPNFKGLFDTFMDLVSYLEDLFGKKVDLITKGNLSPYIKPYIEKEVKWYEI